MVSFIFGLLCLAPIYTLMSKQGIVSQEYGGAILSGCVSNFLVVLGNYHT